MHHLIENNKPGLVIYGSFNGYDKLYSLNVNSPKYYDDLYNVTSAFKLIDDYKQYSILGRTINKLCSIFSIHTGNKDKEGRNVFYTISIIYENLTPSTAEIFKHIINIQRKFQKDCIDEERKTIKLDQLDSFCNNIFPTLEFKRIIALNEVKDEILTIEDESYEWWDDLENIDVFDYLDNFDKNNTIYLTSKAIRVGSNVTQIIDGTPIIRSFNVLSVSNIKELLHTERMTKRFSFSPFSNKNTIIPGILSLKFGSTSIEKRVKSTAVPIEFIVEDNAEGILKFRPDDNIKYKVYELNSSFSQLKGYTGSTLLISIEENPSRRFKVESDVNISGLMVSCNGKHLIPEQDYYTIYDQLGSLEISSTSHQIEVIPIVEIPNNSTIPLLSNYIEIELFERNNKKIEFSKDIELFANGERLSSNYINRSRSDFPLKIELKSKKYLENDSPSIPKDFSKSKLIINLEGTSIIPNKSFPKGEVKGKNSGIIGPDNTKSRYSTAKAKVVIFSLIGILILASGYFIYIKLITPKTNSNVNNTQYGTVNIEVLCEKDTTCENSTTETSSQALQVQEVIIDQNDDSKNKTDSKLEKADSENKVKEKISCDNFSGKSIKEKKSFCKDDVDRECHHCIPSCTNYIHLSKATQEAYCNDPGTKCSNCPKTASENANSTPNGGNKSESKTEPNDCSHLDGLSGKALENICKKNMSCEKCKNINKK